MKNPATRNALQLAMMSATAILISRLGKGIYEAQTVRIVPQINAAKT
jgi:hypothetical protein